MHEVRLTVKKRAFPSQGRVRLNIAHLSVLGIREGEYVDLVNEATKKSVTTAVIADTMVREGHVRVSEEDLKTIGLLDDEDVLVRKTQVSEEKIKKAAANAATLLAKDVSKPDDTVGKTAGSLKKRTKKATDAVEKAAAKSPRKIKTAPGSDENR
jgi:aspartate 1-decarboxylase